jgi:hypothetical protein
VDPICDIRQRNQVIVNDTNGNQTYGLEPSDSRRDRIRKRSTLAIKICDRSASLHTERRIVEASFIQLVKLIPGRPPIKDDRKNVRSHPAHLASSDLLPNRRGRTLMRVLGRKSIDLLRMRAWTSGRSPYTSAGTARHAHDVPPTVTPVILDDHEASLSRTLEGVSNLFLGMTAPAYHLDRSGTTIHQPVRSCTTTVATLMT